MVRHASASAARTCTISAFLAAAIFAPWPMRIADAQQARFDDASGGRLNAPASVNLFEENDYRIETQIAPSLSVAANMQVDPARGQADGPFRNPSLYLQELFAKYEWNDAGLRVGKFNPRGDLLSGPYGVDSAVGANAYTRMNGGRLGNYTVGASAFNPDDTLFNGRVVVESDPVDVTRARPGQARPNYAAIRNAANPASFALTLDGRKVFDVPGLRSHLGFHCLACGQPGADAQRTGFVAGLTYAPPAWNARFKTTAEFGYLKGLADLPSDKHMPVMGLSGSYDNWRAYGNFAQAWRGNDSLSDVGTTDRRYSAGLGYNFEEGSKLDLNWSLQASEPEHETARADMGLRVRYGFSF